MSAVVVLKDALPALYKTYVCVRQLQTMLTCIQTFRARRYHTTYRIQLMDPPRRLPPAHRRPPAGWGPCWPSTSCVCCAPATRFSRARTPRRGTSWWRWPDWARASSASGFRTDAARTRRRNLPPGGVSRRPLAAGFELSPGHWTVVHASWQLRSWWRLRFVCQCHYRGVSRGWPGWPCKATPNPL